jgi:uncharacterized small protein (DUF1192 family)
MDWQVQRRRWLTESSFQLAPAGRRQQHWILLAAVALLVAILLAAPLADLLGTTRELGVARDRETVLAAEVERLETRLAVEAATRRELELQAGELNARVAELTAQVEFLSARNPGAGASRR